MNTRPTNRPIDGIVERDKEGHGQCSHNSILDGLLCSTPSFISCLFFVLLDLVSMFAWQPCLTFARKVEISAFGCWVACFRRRRRRRGSRYTCELYLGVPHVPNHGSRLQRRVRTLRLLHMRFKVPMLTLCGRWCCRESPTRLQARWPTRSGAASSHSVWLTGTG
jgi:hypothetical protein